MALVRYGYRPGCVNLQSTSVSKLTYSLRKLWLNGRRAEYLSKDANVSGHEEHEGHEEKRTNIVFLRGLRGEF